MTAAVPIGGTVSISLGDGMPAVVANFTVPVVLEDEGHGLVTFHAAPVDAIKAAATSALLRAADDLLESLPTAQVTAAHIATCSDCGAKLASNDPNLRIEHGEGDNHIASSTCGGAR
ncbi:hypothetical protein RS84_00238 [Microbacterium hydrocarbonoxydans]|uniref:Uncharacterized protein n=1 Tax=Microbacterium hydrocarbonoxydans TaxID=273678 RepID=A0A0M2HX70_9MICO|nr:hypothetical protein [Microbacterium hydrocarbonoxydans]KJL49525.1 hypothetical protein RS84_00238 [Microbacterium hydrocarbonoxydans]